MQRNPLEGFDDREENVVEQGDAGAGAGCDDDLPLGATAMAEEEEDEAEHCAVCLSPISNKVSLVR